MSHPLERHLVSTGLRRAALFYDTACTLHRGQFLEGDAELCMLAPEQVLMVVILTDSHPGDPAWKWAETRLGTLPHG